MLLKWLVHIVMFIVLDCRMFFGLNKTIERKFGTLKKPSRANDSILLILWRHLLRWNGCFVIFSTIVTVHKALWWCALSLFDCGLLDIPKTATHIMPFIHGYGKVMDTTLLCVTIYNTKIKSNNMTRREKKRSSSHMSLSTSTHSHTHKTKTLFPCWIYIRIQ